MKKKLLIFLLSLAFISKSQTILMTTLNYTASSSASNIAVCSNTFYDDGGSAGNYSNSQYAVHTMYSKLTSTTNITNYKLSIYTNSCVLAANDTLYLYNGFDLSAPLLATFTGTTAGNPSYMSSSGAITFKFRSDAVGSAPGWAFTLNCLTPSLTAISTPTMNKGKTYSVTINGTRTSFLSSSPIKKMFLAMGPDSIPGTTLNPINDTVMTMNFNIPCLLTPSVTSLNLVAYGFGQGILSLGNMVTPLTLGASMLSTSITCNSMCNGLATSTPINGNTPFTYTWSPSGGNTTTASGLCAGMYSLSISDFGGCTTTTFVSINQPPVLSASSSQNSVTCFGASNGSATATPLGGTPPYTFLWTPSSVVLPSITNVSAGTYSCNVTDNNGCTAITPITIIQPAVINGLITPTNVTCFSACNGAASISANGGTPPYTYTWSPSGGNSITAINLCAGAYSCAITDMNACVVTKTINVNQPASASASSANNNIPCFGGNNGSSTISVVGGAPPFTYSWVPSGGISTVAINLTAQTYTCIITDVNSCVLNKTVALTQPTAISSTVNQNNVTCFGGNNGSATLTISGGTPGYTLNWTPSGGSTPTISNVASGNYTCNVVDLNGCTYNTSLTITQPAALTCAISGQSTLCLNQTFSATATHPGAVSPITYSWTELPSTAISSAASLTLNPTTGSHSYYLAITDANNCSAVSNTLALTVNSLKPLSGVASVSSNPVAGNVILYRFVSIFVKFDSVTYQPLNALGEFTFNTLNANTYILKCVPSANSLQLTYAPNEISWKTATVITHGCINNSTKNIDVVPLTNIGSGPGTLSGKITEGQGYHRGGIFAPGNPIGGLNIKGGRNPGGNIVSQGKTNSAGEYTLSGLPLNVAGENYFILVDIPGLDTNTTYHEAITTSSTQYGNLDFIVDSAQINPIQNVSIKEFKLSNGNVKVYPNPTNGFINLEVVLRKQESIEVKLNDVTGKEVLNIIPSSTYFNNELKLQLHLEELNYGIYFMKFKIGDAEKTVKIIITN